MLHQKLKESQRKSERNYVKNEHNETITHGLHSSNSIVAIVVVVVVYSEIGGTMCVYENCNLVVRREKKKEKMAVKCFVAIRLGIDTANG